MLAEDLNAAVHELRGALLELVTNVGGDPYRPQDVSRRFGLDKSLTWKVSRVVGATAPDEALLHMPGDMGFEIFVAALERKGAKRNLVRRARSAIDGFKRAIDAEVGDRPTLAIVLDSLPSSKDRLANSRKLAFRGNSGIWGVQARVRYNTVLLSPNAADADMVDCCNIGGWVDFRRMRPDIRWPLFQVASLRNGETISGDEPIDESLARNRTKDLRDDPMLLRDFCTSSLPSIEARPAEVGQGTIYELGPGPIGNSGLFTCFFGSMHRSLGSRFATTDNESADFLAGIAAPVETFVFDWIVERSLGFARDPSLSVYGTLHSGLANLLPNQRLPIKPMVSDLGQFPPVLANAKVSNYSELMRHVFTRMKLDPTKFLARRFTIEFPVFPSTILLSCPLETR